MTGTKAHCSLCERLADARLQEKARYLRRRAFAMVMQAGKGHLGGSFSCTEILVALYYGGVLRFDPGMPTWGQRDRFILSKGHANNTLYVLLADLGFFSEEELGGYGRDGSLLGGHCDPQVPGVEVVTGSLGHGLGIGAGIALGARLDQEDYLTFVLLGDGECQEGSVWEAALFAGHHGLGNLVAIVDRNGLGSEEFTERSMRLEPLADKWTDFGWEARLVDGHSPHELRLALADCRLRQSHRPLVIVAHTVKGKGISCLENTPRAHHTLPQGEDIAIAARELA